MAYFDAALADGFAGYVRSAEPVLSPLERDVVALARRDDLASLSPPSRARRVAKAVFGFRTAGPLADVRLETLRRFAVLASRNAEVAPAVEALLIQGYVPSQIELVRRVATRSPVASRRRVPDLFTAASDGFAWLGTYLWVRAGVGNSLVAAIVAAYYGLPAPAAPRHVLH